MRISRIEIVYVKVPANSGAISSPETDAALHRLAVGADEPWTRQFDELEKAILLATCDDGTVGVGESLRDPRVEVMQAMARRLLGAEIERLSWSSLPIARTREYDAFESLVYDLAGKLTGLPVVQLLGGPRRDRVLVSAWSGHRTPADAADRASRALSDGIHTIKFKCDLESDVVGWAEAIKDACGPDMKIVLDPNERFDELRHATAIARELEAIGNVAIIEDPLPRWDLDAYAELRRHTIIPIAVHVALGYAELGQKASDLHLALRARAADVFNFSGGIADFMRLAAAADLAGMSYWHGSEVDLGVLEAAHVHAAAAASGCTLPSDVFGRRIRSHDLLAEPLCLDGPYVRVPTGPGLGVEVDREALAAHEIGRTSVAA